jgi:putative effector of murein hydrolase
MVDMLIVIYLVGWLPVTFAVYAAGKRLSDRRTPAVHPVLVSVAAGALWPLLVVGLVELSSIIVFTKAPSKSGRGIGIYA